MLAAARESFTTKTATRVPVFPSTTSASAMDSAGGVGLTVKAVVLVTPAYDADSVPLAVTVETGVVLRAPLSPLAAAEREGREHVG